MTIAAGGITSSSFASGAITADAIAADAIGASEIAADAIGSSEIAADAIGASEIAANAIGASEVADGAIDAGAIANNAIDAATFASDVDAEILSYIVDDATRIDASALNTATGTSIPAILVDTGTTLDGKLDTIDSVVDAIKAVTDNLPDSGALSSLATASALATVDSVVDTIQATTDKLDDTLENNSGTYRFTEASLAQAPAGEGGGGGTDWDADERTAIRAILGIPVSGSTPADPSSGILDAIRDSVAGLNDLSSSDVQSASAAALAAYDPPTHGELTSALAAADDAVLSAIAALENLSAEDIWTYLIDDQGSVQARCAMAALLSFAAGDFTTSSNTTTFEDSTGAETRLVMVTGANSRTVTITCPSY